MKIRIAKRTGSKPLKPKCAHTRRYKERILGAQTGDYICADCGEEMSGPETPPRPSARVRR